MNTCCRYTQLVGLAFMISACSSHQAVMESASIYDQQALSYLRADNSDLEKALASWSSATNVLVPGDSRYFEDERYIERARFSSNQALAQLLWDKPDEARESYISLLDQLKSDVEQHRETAMSFNENIQMFSLAAAMVGSGLLTYYGMTSNPTASYAESQTLSRAALDVGQAIYELGSLDWAGLEEIKDHSPADLEIDFIRMPFFAHYHEMAAIGRLRSSDGGSCTASLVGHRLALTNAHCVYSKLRPRQPSELTLEFDKLGAMRHRHPEKSAYQSGGSFSVVAVHVAPDWVPVQGDTTSRHNCGRDWALLELADHPVGIDFFEVKPDLDFHSDDAGIAGIYRSDPIEGYALVADQVSVAGFSGDLNSGSLITLDHGCPVSWSDSSVGYQCATYKGASGSPILMANGPYRLNTVVGVNACMSPDQTADSWRTYVTRDDVIGSSTGTPARRFVPKLLELREKTGTAYSPSGIGVATEVVSITSVVN